VGPTKFAKVTGINRQHTYKIDKGIVYLETVMRIMGAYDMHLDALDNRPVSSKRKEHHGEYAPVA
jgi:DNA-binding phage protein